MGVSRIFSYGGKTVWMLVTGFVIAAILSVMLLTKTAELRYQRDVNRMVYNDNLGVLNEVKAKLGMTGDSLKMLLNESPAEAANIPYIVVSMADHRLWYNRARKFCSRRPSRQEAGRNWWAARMDSGGLRHRAADSQSKGRMRTQPGFRPTGTTSSRRIRKDLASSIWIPEKRFRPATAVSLRPVT